MKVGFYKNKEYYLNEFFGEIWRREVNSKTGYEKLVKVRDFHKYNSMIHFEPEKNSLINKVL